MAVGDIGKPRDLYGEQFPYYAEVLAEAELWSLDKQFDYGLECVLAGIKSRLAVR